MACGLTPYLFASLATAWGSLSTSINAAAGSASRKRRGIRRQAAKKLASISSLGRGATRRPAAEEPHDRRGTGTLGQDQARARQPEEQAGGSHTLHARTLGRAQPLPRRRPHRDRLERGRALDPADRPQPQERALRRLRRRRRALGHHRFARGNREAQRRRSSTPTSPTSSPASSPAIPRARSTTSCSGLRPRTPQGRGLRTAVTLNAQPKHVVNMGSCHGTEAEITLSGMDCEHQAASAIVRRSPRSGRKPSGSRSAPVPQR